MESKISCEIIKDLLPLYADGLTSEYTNKEIEVHLLECKECEERYSALITRLELDVQGSSEKEIDYLGKLNRRQKRNVILGSVISFFVGAFIPMAKYIRRLIDVFFSGGKLTAYQIARLQVIWPELVAVMFISGLVLVLLLFLIRFIVKKFRSRKLTSQKAQKHTSQKQSE